MIAYLVTNTINGKQYVGITIRTLRQRWTEHCKPRSRSCRALKLAIAEYEKSAFTVEHIASALSLSGLKLLERSLIAQYRTLHPLGYNLNEGGGGDSSDETRRLLSMANIGRVHGPEARANMAAGAKGKIVSAATRAIMSSQRRGRKQTNAAKEKISANKNRSAKISAALRGRVHTPEHNAKIGAAHTGMKRSAEARANMVAAQRAYRQRRSAAVVTASSPS